MMYIKTDANNYWTGEYAEIGGIEGGVEVETIPEEPDVRRRRAYALTDGALILDTAKLAEIETEITTAAPAQTEAERIAALEADNAELRAAIEALIGGAE